MAGKKERQLEALKCIGEKKRCVVKEGQCGRIDKYFLRSQSSKSDEVQRQVENHRPKDINNTAKEVEEKVLRR